MAARYHNDIDIAKAQRDFELKKAVFDMEVQTKVRSVCFSTVNLVSYFIVNCLLLES